MGAPAMDGQTEAPGAMPTASWLAEQEAKQAAYAARRRAWTLRLKHRALSDDDEADELAVPSLAAGDGAPPAATGHATRLRRARGTVHDPRQSRFEF